MNKIEKITYYDLISSLVNHHILKHKNYHPSANDISSRDLNDLITKYESSNPGKALQLYSSAHREIILMGKGKQELRTMSDFRFYALKSAIERDLQAMAEKIKTRSTQNIFQKAFNAIKLVSLQNRRGACKI